MAKSLAHTKYMCKYHIVFIPKYRRKVIYNKLRKDIQGYRRFPKIKVTLLTIMEIGSGHVLQYVNS